MFSIKVDITLYLFIYLFCLIHICTVSGADLNDYDTLFAALYSSTYEYSYYEWFEERVSFKEARSSYEVAFSRVNDEDDYGMSFSDIPPSTSFDESPEVDVAPSVDKMRLRQEFPDTWLWVDCFTK